MKEKYVEAEMNIVSFEVEDIICDSLIGEDSYDQGAGGSNL